MKIRTILTIAVIAIVAFSGCKQYEKLSVESVQIRVGPGPEDIAFDMEEGKPRLIVSCAERRKKNYPKFGEFWTLDLQDDRAVPMVIKEFPDSIHLHPHGIDIGISAGVKTLFVVNHEDQRKPDRHLILKFAIKAQELIYLGHLAASPMLESPNDVCFDGNHGVFVSNDSGKRNSLWEKFWGLRRSNVVHHDLKSGSWSLAVDQLAYANGVGVNKGKLYVSAVQEYGVRVYTKQETGWSLTDTIGDFKGADNITFYGNQLYTTTHPAPMKFLKHMGDNRKASPGFVYQADIETGKVQKLYADDGSLMSAPSTALRFNNSLYVAHVFRPYLLKLPLIQNEQQR